MKPDYEEIQFDFEKYKVLLARLTHLEDRQEDVTKTFIYLISLITGALIFVISNHLKYTDLAYDFIAIASLLATLYAFFAFFSYDSRKKVTLEYLRELEARFAHRYGWEQGLFHREARKIKDFNNRSDFSWNFLIIYFTIVLILVIYFTREIIIMFK